MSSDTALPEVARILAEVADVDTAEVHLDTSFADELELDSLTMVEIATAVEDRFGVVIPDETIPGLRTVRDVVELLGELPAAA